MHKSIFVKFFSIIASILIVCFILLGGFLLAATRSQWKENKRQLLSNNVRTISEFCTQTFRSGGGLRDEMDNTVTVIGQIIGADIYIVSPEGQIVLCSDHDDQSCRHNGTVVKQSFLKEALQGESEFTGKMGGIYNTVCYTVSTPIKYNGNSVAAVFASVPVSGADTAVFEMFNVIFVASALVLLIAFVAVYIITSQITRPLRQMAVAAHKMENGEFVSIPPVRRKDEIGMLVEAFNRMSKSLSQLEEMRRSFVSSVSHELKTPMTTMSGFVDGMLDGTIKQEDYPKYLQIVSTETKRLARLVNSMLQMSRLESESMKLNYSTFNVSDQLVRIMLSFESKIEEKNIDIRGLENTSKTMLCADCDLMYQVLYNLVENAIKFTPENGYIFVSVEENRDNVKISIKNSGEGLNSVELSRIFERFYKTDRSRSKDKTGMGFGLYIVKMIVGLHGGQINAESVLNEYTQFTVTLPNNACTPEQITVDGDGKKTKSGIKKKKNGDGVDENAESVVYDAEVVENNVKGDSSDE